MFEVKTPVDLPDIKCPALFKAVNADKTELQPIEVLAKEVRPWDPTGLEVSHHKS